MSGVKEALIRGTFDPDARVREAAAAGLGPLPITGAAALDAVVRVRSLARTDRSLIVRGAALASDILLEKDAAIPLAKEMMAKEEWEDVIRRPALSALKAVDTPEARALMQQYAPASQ
jgi:HEAT repeat protein